MPSKQTIVITGADGTIGTVLCEHLGDKFNLIGTTVEDGELDHVQQTKRVDLTDREQVRGLFADADAVIHLAIGNASPDADWSVVFEKSMTMDFNVLSECVDAGISRLIYASSNHVHHGTHMLDGQHERMDPSQLGAHVGRTISLDETLWPDSYYAVGKITAEGMCRYFAAKHGLEVIALRIGAVNSSDDPTDVSESGKAHRRGIFLSHRDCAQVFERALAAPIRQRPPFMAAFATSDNARNIFNLDKTREMLGFAPKDDAEVAFRREQAESGGGRA